MSDDPRDLTVAQLMAREGVSQRTLARRLEVSQGHLSKLLRGLVPDPKNLIGRAKSALATPASPAAADKALAGALAHAARFHPLLRSALEEAVAQLNAENAN
ncbi:helix-turn-helix domain-containing protein [Azospirillum sp. YIM DDC1]|uniref:Helix-turn-helix domain-containing protein n=1 Tax=Azospirillum aestuarii TaxID=2802052 RepID=A0ABS1I7M6_9PROT|nr:helix-turn-helix domain-containing protein [Azospirillum aestuarii]